MHEWRNGENLISSWASWHWFRWFVPASSLALVQKPTLIHGTVSSEEGEVPLPGAKLLCCVSRRNLLMKYGANIPPRSQVLQGNAVQCYVVTPAPSAQGKTSCSCCSITCEEKNPVPFPIAIGPSPSPKKWGIHSDSWGWGAHLAFTCFQEEAEYQNSVCWVWRAFLPTLEAS